METSDYASGGTFGPTADTDESAESHTRGAAKASQPLPAGEGHAADGHGRLHPHDPKGVDVAMDVHTPEQRSRNMSAIRGKDTKPEMAVRCIVHALGYRYRLHRRDLPGAPDLVFPRLQKIINVHGCFWHMHKCRY